MSERPVVFNDAMVRAILDGSKTQTRRPVLPGGGPVHAGRDGNGWRRLRDGWAWCVGVDVSGGVYPCPYGVPGDLLYVRECWSIVTGAEPGDLGAAARYRADNSVKACWMPPDRAMPLGLKWDRWRPSVHMPRWASRITLRVTSVGVERVQDISEEGARAEGVRPLQVDHGSYLPGFEALWDSIYAARGLGWEANPWVWVVGFDVVDATAREGG